MIIDKLVNLHLYIGISEKVKNALEYISETDFSEMDPGKFVLKDPNMFLIVNEYITKENESNVLEAHKKYIDLQFVFKGCEIVDYETFANQPIVRAYDVENDYALFASKNKSKLKLSEGMFAVFFPNDLHMPGILDKEPDNVKKIVIKILI